MFAPQTIPASPAVLMYRNPKKGILCALLIQGMSTIAPSSFPGLPIFLPRCDPSASFVVRVYVSIVAGGSLTMYILAPNVKPCYKHSCFHPPFLMISGGAVSWVTVAAIFLSNIPEGLSSAAGMKKAGRSMGYVFGVWGAIAVISGIAALLGYTVFSHFSGEVIAATTAVAAGGILATISDTMIPEAFEETHDFAGLITVGGFRVAFVLSKLGET